MNSDTASALSMLGSSDGRWRLTSLRPSSDRVRT